ncbi:hypothetical protein BU25DRAFT_456179 [Macroventuria anomochaeta]|uniref:Uncharacterized protein n=1 Tax=Macroventuria anomochaeta TaxID=301207 RepID=A0ACB6SAV9_9PLEO|nr:uncharacterized protein BU25DRAFT_456179 [Macroventuria anomochaeta]KAF2630449.1 hypothetical protein BU25DRAFT_456179 [Macroventuria anomochaeta]
MINWDATKDQTILRGIFAFHNIKNSQPLLEYLAKEIGEGCTPKAVSHRLTSLRKSDKIMNSDGSSATPKKVVSTPRTPRTPTSSRGRAKASRSKKNTDNYTISDDADEDDKPVASPSVGRKRVRTSKAPASYAESDATTGDDEEEFTPVSKRVKTEPVEAEGLASVTDNQAQVEKEDESVAFN